MGRLPKDVRKVKLRGKVRYQKRVTVQRADGASRQISATAQNAKACKVDFDRKLAEFMGGSDVSAGGEIVTVSDLLARWLRARRGTVSEKTLETYEQRIRVIDDALGGLGLDQLTGADVEEGLTSLYDAGRSAASLNGDLQTLKTALNWGVTQARVLRENPAKGVKKFRNRSGEASNEVRFFTPDEVARLLAIASRQPENAALYRMLLLGLRRGEALGLQWEDIDGKVFHVRRAVKIERGGLVVGDLKTSTSRRTLPLPAETANALEVWKSKQSAKYMKDQIRPVEPWIFDAGKGVPRDPSSVSQLFSRHCAQLDIEGRRLHDMRHTAASFAISGGAHANVIKALLGHSTITTTLNVYGHLFPEDLTSAVEAIERVAKKVGGS